MTSNAPWHDATEAAALYLSGAMTGSEREAFEAALQGGDAQLAAEVERLQESVEVLGEAVVAVQPPAAVRQAILNRIERESSGSAKSQIWRNWRSDEDADLYTLRAEEGSWEETGVTGVQVRRLYVDRASNRMTAMFRMSPGTSYPEHIHAGPEECYVLEGDLHVGDTLVMRAGDYQRAHHGSEHDRQWTQSGCLLLVTSSLSDELV